MHLQMKYLLFTLVLLFFHSVHAQPTNPKFSFEKVNPANVVDSNGFYLGSGAWSGGSSINQFFNFDVNGDGSKDILVFEKEDSAIYTYINLNASGKTKYAYAPKYQSCFPFVQDWIDFADYDGDGKMDLFGNNNGDTKLYRNITPNGNPFPVFTLVTNSIPVRYYPNFPPANMYVNSTDNAEVLDIDHDGDVDVIAWDIISPRINWYKNLSMERYGRKDTLDFKLETTCWGRFTESFNSNDLRLCLDEYCARDTSKICPCGVKIQIDPIEKTTHTGGTLTIFDQNKDGKYDLLEGDVSYSNMIFVQNAALAGLDSFSCGLDTVFPKYTRSIYLPVFPHASRLDVNDDQRLDLVANPFDESGKRYHNHWLYENTSSSSSSPDVFTLVDTNWFPAPILDFPKWSAPEFLDVDQDGDLDILVATQNARNLPTLMLLENKNGTYYWNDTNYAQINAKFNRNYLTPTFGDLNGDSIPDMICGHQFGTLAYFTGQWVQGKIDFAFVQDSLLNQYFYYYTAPQLVDANQDGLLDLLTGNSDGQALLVYNVVTKFNAQFNTTADTLGNIDLNDIYPGNSVPRLADFNADGKMDLAMGEAGGRLLMFDDIFDTVLHKEEYCGYESFPLAGASVQKVDLGASIRLSVADWNHDSLPDLLIGTFNGGLIAMQNKTGSLNSNNLTKENSLKIYPNPANESIELFIDSKSQATKMEIFDLMGRLTKVFSIAPGQNKVQINTENLNNGMYLIRWNHQIGKVLIQH